MAEFQNTELQTKFDQYNSDKKLSKSELHSLLTLADSLYKKASDTDKQKIKQDMDEIKTLIDQLPVQEKAELESLYTQVRGQLDRLQTQVLNQSGKTDSKEQFETSKKNYETLQQAEIAEIKNAFDLAFAQLEGLQKFSIKNKTEIKNKLNNLKDGQSIYVEGPADKNGKRPTIFHDLLQGFHDEYKGTNQDADDQIDKDAKAIVANLEKTLDTIVSDPKINGVTEYTGGIAGYEIKDGSKISTKINEIFSTQNNIDGKSKKDVEDAIKAGKLVDITINTDKDGKKTYKYSEAIQKTPNAQGSLTIKETTDGKDTENFSDIQNALKNITNIKLDGKTASGDDILNLIKSGKSVSLVQQADLSYLAKVSDGAKKLTVTTLGPSVGAVEASDDYQSVIDAITPAALNAKIDSDTNLTADQKTSLKDFVKDIKIVHLNGNNYQISLGGKNYPLGTNFNLSIENNKVVIKSTDKGVDSGVSFKFEGKKLATQPTTSDAYSFDQPEAATYLTNFLKKDGSLDWTITKLTGDLPKTWNELQKSNKSLVVKLLQNGKTEYKLVDRTTAPKLAPIFIKVEGKTTVAGGTERLNGKTESWLKMEDYSDTKVLNFLNSPNFVKFMQTVNNTSQYKQFISTVQSGNYDLAAQQVVNLLKVPGSDKIFSSLKNSSEKRKFVDDVVEAAFGDEHLGDFNIKLQHLAQNGLSSLQDDYKNILSTYQSSTESQMSGLMSILSFRNIPRKEYSTAQSVRNGDIIQKGFTTHTEVFASGNAKEITGAEAQALKPKVLNTLILTPDMKKAYLESKGLTGISDVNKTWNELLTQGKTTVNGKNISIIPGSEKVTVFLVKVCQNPGMKYDFDLQAETKTSTTTPPEYKPLSAKNTPITTPGTQSDVSANFGINAAPIHTDATQGVTSDQTVDYTVDTTAGQPTSTTDTTYPDAIPGTPETITPPDTSITITIDHPTTPPYIPPVDHGQPTHTQYTGSQSSTTNSTNTNGPGNGAPTSAPVAPIAPVTPVTPTTQPSPIIPVGTPTD